jgi:hypothetical protein
MKTKTHFAFRVDIWGDTGDASLARRLVLDHGAIYTINQSVSGFVLPQEYDKASGS